MRDESQRFRDNTTFSRRYRLQEKVGEGGTGVVFRAQLVEPPQRIVAVKFLLDPTRSLLLAWRNDPSVLTELAHPRLVKVHDCGFLEGTPFLEMEYVEGITLRRAMKPGVAWPLDRVASILFSLSEALDYLHQRGLLHLDLKPENVLLSVQNKIKLADLDGVVPRGISRLTWERGSPDYCAPEQRFGLPVDERADVFALASVGYELLTGRLPGRVFVRCSERNTALPVQLDDVFRTGLARDPHDRPDSLPAFASMLRVALAPK